MYPGFNSDVIRAACKASGINLKSPTRKQRINARSVDAFTREEFEKIMIYHGYKLIEQPTGSYWVRFMTADL